MVAGGHELHPFTQIVLSFWTTFPGLAVLVLMMTTDILFGIAVAYVTKTISSKLSQIGMLRKAAVILITGMSLACEQAVSGVIDVPLSSMVAGLFAVSEFISIVENAAIIGVPIPQQVAEALIVLKRNYKPVDIRTMQPTPDPPPVPPSETETP